MGGLHRLPGGGERPAGLRAGRGAARRRSTSREIYDAFTYMTLVTLEDLGFCAKGEGGAFVEKGRLMVGAANCR